ncbi:MAG TPA: PilT/PilU family type 4a pilus ATPase [Acidimicrobiia bacterium]|nr:PilT/PilU family type 4a pilus ATPase [Acidimicrobiia bacterium]
MSLTFDELLRRAVESRASDVHLKVGSPPVIRIDGELRRLADLPTLRPDDVQAFADEIFSEKAAATFDANGEADFAYGRPDLGRFRVGAFRQRGSISLVLRRVVPGVPTIDQLGLPPVVRKLAAEPRGLILVTGPAGSGRTTTLAAIVEHINQTQPVSIITIEDPIEVLFPDKMAVVAQREVGVDTPDLASAIRKAMRQDADVILVSEINDFATASAALDAAETGHLVLSAMHTKDPLDTVARFVEFFPDNRHGTVRRQLAALLRGVISQRLLDTADGSGRVLATEVLTGYGRVTELIAEGADPARLIEAVKESEFFGMQTFDQALLNLVTQRRVSLPTALPFVRNSHEFRAKAQEAGVEV